MAPLNPKAVNSSRGQHPDLDENNNLRADVFVDPAERDFRRLQQDESAWATFMTNVAGRQSLEPQSVQEWVQGRTYAPESGPLAGYRAYLEDLDYARLNVAASSGKTVFIDDADIRRMSDSEYDACFDERGKPREHVYYHPNRSHRVDATMDHWTARELQQSRPRKDQP